LLELLLLSRRSATAAEGRGGDEDAEDEDAERFRGDSAAEEEVTTSGGGANLEIREGATTSGASDKDAGRTGGRLGPVRGDARWGSEDPGRSPPSVDF
jgi:hypothetical protein